MGCAPLARTPLPSPRRYVRQLHAVLAMGWLLLGLAMPVQASEAWSLSDGAGHRFRATVFEQPFAEYPSGWRIRLNALEADMGLDHDADLLLSDAQGHAWRLPNRSEELVPRGVSPVPAGSAQFDLDALSPRPSDAIPLQLEVQTADGPLRFELTPAQTQELHALAQA
jgi:hypothetical protein